MTYGIDLPAFEGPYLTQDADFLGNKEQARLIARMLDGRVRIPTMDENTPNTAVVAFDGEAGQVLLIDFLDGLIGVHTNEIKKRAVPLQIDGNAPILILHPLLVLQSRCANLHELQSKRDANGITQAKVACIVVQTYLADCMRTSERRREGLKAVKFLGRLARSEAGIFVWKNYQIDVMAIIDDKVMPLKFPLYWGWVQREVARKRAIAARMHSRRISVRQRDARPSR
jgi:hypothetical protein